MSFRNSKLVLESFRTLFEVILNLFRGHSELVSASFQTCFSVIPNLFQCHSELVSESLPPKASLLRPTTLFFIIIPILKQVQGRNLLQESTYQNEQEADSPAFLWHDKWHWQSRAASRRCLFPPHPLFLAR